MYLLLLLLLLFSIIRENPVQLQRHTRNLGYYFLFTRIIIDLIHERLETEICQTNDFIIYYLYIRTLLHNLIIIIIIFVIIINGGTLFKKRRAGFQLGKISNGRIFCLFR